MRIRYYFLIFVLLLLVVLSLMTYLMAGNGTTLFYVMESVIFLTIVFLIVFYRKIVKPLNTISNGMDLLKEQDFSSRLSPVGQYEADRIVKVFNRMMEQLKNERINLRAQNHFLDLLIQASPMGVVIFDLDGHIVSLNPSAVRMFGFTVEAELLGKGLAEIDAPLSQELLNMRSEGVRTVRLNDSTIYKCTLSSFVDKGFRHSFILIESLTQEVMKAEKKAYEKVIRMIAHEVNNTTAGITSTLDTVDSALGGMPDTDDIREAMQVCIDRCFGMSRFITNFADVVKIPELCVSSVNLNEVVLSCKRFMETVCRNRNISVHVELCEKPLDVSLDTVLFEQVLVNIMKNAAESIGTDGDIYIRTTAAPVSLEIADTGKGIDKETETKLFTPFFSTKPHGQGIGLIFIREVLLKHSCTFSLRTYADGLTRFKIRFPA